MVGQAMPNVDLPMAGGGEFRGEDLLGRTTILLVRAKFGEAPHAFMDAWDASVADGSNPLDLMVLMMDQYGDVKPYEDGKYARYPYPIAVGRKWVREWFGNFKGDALVLVVALWRPAKVMVIHQGSGQDPARPKPCLVSVQVLLICIVAARYSRPAAGSLQMT